jgi:glycosyltransferase involved in cell wall biosynthesis
MTRDLVVFAEDFGRHPASTEHLVRRLAETRKVVWMNSIGMRTPKFSRTDINRAFEKLGHLARRPTAQKATDSHANTSTTPASIDVVAPHALPMPGHALAFHVNRALLSRQVRARMASSNISKPLLWITLPSALPVVGTLDEHAVIYYCADDFGTLAGIDHAPILTMQDKIVDRADLIIVVSDVLAAKFPAHKTIVVPHGVDYDTFATPAPRAADLPTGRKIAGFYGSLPHWVDPALVARTAAALPDWLFVFVGGGQLFENEKAPANTLFLGPRPHTALPGYVQHWDVSLLPYRDCEPLRAGNPLKLREYMAAGTPIASVDFPALAPYRDLVSLAADPANFTAAVLAAAEDGARNTQRQHAVVSETWEARAADVAAALEKL